VARRLKRGELYYVKPPGFVGKVRPAVVVQSDRFNDDPPSATVCLLTSHIVESKLRVQIEPGAANGLTKISQVMIDKVMTLPLDRLDNPIGIVSKAELDAISASLRVWLDL
jgi:mRNA interferase MazF